MCTTSIQVVCPQCGAGMARHKKAMTCADVAAGGAKRFGSCPEGVQTTPVPKTAGRACESCRRQSAAGLAERNRIAALQRESDKWHVCRDVGYCERSNGCPKLRPDWGGPMPREY